MWNTTIGDNAGHCPQHPCSPAVDNMGKLLWRKGSKVGKAQKDFYLRVIFQGRSLQSACCWAATGSCAQLCPRFTHRELFSNILEPFHFLSPNTILLQDPLTHPWSRSSLQTTGLIKVNFHNPKYWSESNVMQLCGQCLRTWSGRGRCWSRPTRQENLWLFSGGCRQSDDSGNADVVLTVGGDPIQCLKI